MQTLPSSSRLHGSAQQRSDYPTPEIRLARPDIGEEEIEAVARVLRSSVLTNGPETQTFEASFAEYHDVEYGIAFANGTLALVAVLQALGIGPGDEVIVPSLTFVSSATSISLVGATPVFADVRQDSFNIDPNDVARKLSKRTRAVMAVHYGGQAADLEDLLTLCDDAGVHLLEDAAEAHGATYRGRPVGGWGRAGMFSFTPTKNITTGEGGLITTNDGELASTLRLLRNHGQTALYQHEFLGWNMRITEMQAAMGQCQLAKLDAILKRKRANAEFLTGALSRVNGLRCPQPLSGRDHVYMLYTVVLDRHRDSVLEYLRSEAIEARIYFPPVHKQPIYSSFREADLPVTNYLAEHILSLPMHSLLGESELSRVAARVKLALGVGN